MSDDSVGPGKQGPQIDQGAPSNLLTEAQKRQNVSRLYYFYALYIHSNKTSSFTARQLSLLPIE